MSALLASDPPRMDVEEYLAWTETREGNFELEDGFVLAMAPDRVVHSRAKGAAYRALSNAVAKADAPCETFVEGPGVQIDRATSYQPDVVVQCGERLSGDVRMIDHPVIVVEVLSPSTAYRDLGRKARNYFRVPSIAHYLIVDADDRVVTHKWRGEGGIVLSRDHADGDIVLQPPGIAVSVAGLLPPAEETPA